MYTQTMEVTEIQASTILTPQKVGSLAGHYTYSLNPYAGCAFRCSYCYVPKFPSARHDDYTKWGQWVEAKINAPALIQKERSKVFGSSIFFSSATDPYQYIELKYRLSRKCLKELLRYRPAKLTMHTRSHLILEDVDLLAQFGDIVRVGVSITTDDESVQREFEPGAPSIKRRLQLLQGLKNAGIKVHASLSPLLPCNPQRLVSLLKPFVDTVWIDSMRHPDINNRKDLLEKHADFFEPEKYENLQRWIYEELTQHRLKEGKTRPTDNAKAKPKDRVQQLTLLLTNV